MHYEEVLRHGTFWGYPTAYHNHKSQHTPVKDNDNMSSKPNFHSSYRGILGSIGYLVTMTRSTLLGRILNLQNTFQFRVPG